MAAPIDCIGSVEVLGELGAGANSKIVQVRRADDGREYALKIVPIASADDQKYIDQAEHEFRVAKLLSHPNLVKIYCLESRKNWLFKVKEVRLLIELVRGTTLDAAGPLSLGKTVAALAGVASGLAHMHRRGVYHGDMKPSNVLYAKGGIVKVVDYGLATVKGEARNRVQGTPEYIAPETTKHKVVNDRTDLYNFGATMYRMVTHKLPPSVLTPGVSTSVSGRIAKNSLLSVTDLNKGCPKPLADLIHACMEHDPDKRPARMTEARDCLREVAEAMGEDLPEVVN